jgi:tetratricopeptide (TPR) repeat protein
LRLGRHAEALPAFDAAASAAQAGGDPGRAAQVQLGRIDSLDMLGRTDEALAHAALLEETLRRHGLGVEAAKARVNAGNILFRRDRYADALASYEQALPTLEGGDPLAVASVQANCANILTFLGRADEALALYAQARAAFAGRGLAPADGMYAL